MPKLTKTQQIEAAAQIVHESMRSYKAALGEDALPAWSKATADMRQSTLEGVKFRADNPDAPISAQHDQWMAERLAAGWRKGKAKDAAKKTHPSLVPYEKLAESERRKDALFAAIVRALCGPL